jgi:hypothetical protein
VESFDTLNAEYRVRYSIDPIAILLDDYGNEMALIYED